MSNKEVIIPKGMEAFYERFHFAPAVKSGSCLYCSGQIGIAEDGQVPEDSETQFAQAFENVKTVLAAAGVTFEDVIEMTSYHVGLRTNLRAFTKVKDQYIHQPYPAWTAIGVSELAVPGGLVEIKVIARLRT